jgi:hypothetical protein
VRRWADPAPGERDAGERGWDVVRRAYEERLPAPRRRDRRPFVLVAVAAAVLAAALSPPGLAVWGSLRDAVRGEENAKPALFSLPAAGRLLTESASGVWVVQRDGSKRLLRGYHDASWSPHGLYLAAVRGNELRALEPNGAVHWSLARRGALHTPVWSYDGFRIAYFAGAALRVVNGDATDDHLLTRDVQLGPIAWQPGRHVLAYVNRRGNVQIANVDRRNRTATVRTTGAPHQLVWTRNGLRFVAVEQHAIDVFWQRGPRVGGLDRGAADVVAAAIAPDGRRYAFVQTNGVRSSVYLIGILGGPTERIFSGAGTFAKVVWSPDGRWLLLDWETADQWLFIRTPVKKLVAVSNIRANFGMNASIVGWCCP